MEEFARESPTGKGWDIQDKLSNILKYNTHGTAPQTYGNNSYPKAPSLINLCSCAEYFVNNKKMQIFNF
jgi:hypothetical protein